MRWTTRVTSMAVTGAAVLCTVALSCTTRTAEPPVPAAMDPVARGKYLVAITGCNDCHTPGGLYGMPDTTRLLSGSEIGWQGPWGVSYARNLTPDPATGLGSWSQAEIVQTLRTGKKPDGSPLLPPMPWPNLAALSDEDIDALAAYLKSLPPVTHQMPPALGPSQKATGALLPVPAPPAWDAQNMPPPAESGGH